MSIQLIVYPQNYDGDYNAISSSPTEFLVNGINFNNLNNTGTYTSSVSVPYVDTLTNAPPTISNTWYRFRNNTAGTPDYPSVVAGDLVLKTTAGSTGSRSGIYQKLSNLTIGAQYTITINLSVGTTGLILTKIANGTTLYAQVNSSANTTQVTLNFNAQSTDSTIMIVYYNTIIGTATITDISIQPVIGAIPSGATNVLDNGQVLCDLYEDEDIPLSLSVDDFKNVAEKVQSYSKAFNLPATKRNNKIFDNIFEITRSNDGVIFNPYKKTKCVLKQDGFILFEGYLRMLDVTDKEGETSYNVNLYSEVVALADVLGDRVFMDLGFEELEHDYNRTQIQNSWNAGIIYPNPSTSGFRDANTVKYPFVDWTHQIAVGGSAAAAAAAGRPELLLLETAFRPFINIKYLIDRIFANIPFTYESVFFDSDDFKKLFMDFNWGAEENGAQPYADNYLLQGDNISSDYFINESSYTAASKLRFNLTVSGNNDYWNNTSYKYISPVNNLEVDCEYYIKLESDATVSTYSNNLRIAKFDGSNNHLETLAVNNDSIVANGNKFLQGTFSTVLQANEYIQAQSYSLTADKIRMSNDSIGGYGSWLEFDSTNEGSLVSNLLTRTRGELGQWDFIKGLVTMFNLVTLPDEDNPNNIKFEPYSDVFVNSTDSIQLDWTEKIDVSEMKLTPLADLNKKTIFKFVEDEDDFSFNQYKNDVGGHLYGSQKFNAGNEFNILEGTEEIVAEPFAATIVKPLMSQYSEFITPAVYSMNDDGVSEAFENSPRIMFNNGVKDTGTSYYIPAQNGVSDDQQTDFLQFSHLSDVPTIQATSSVAGSRDFHFGICQLMSNVGAPVPANLFNLYWLPYYSELYNPNTRIMTIKVNLSPADINRFRFNDTVYLKNRVFRVNKIDYKPNDLAKVEFILIP
tara:strand:- start:1596 stop:4331 length:2736 start_codon:yes stop_codon:yes gene_type:complete